MARIYSYFKNINIKKKLTVMVMFVTSIALLFSFIVFSFYNVFKLYENTFDEISLLSQVIGKRTAPALEFNSVDNANKNLKDFSNKESVVLACVYSTNGYLFAEFKQNGEGEECSLSKKLKDRSGYYGGHIHVYHKIYSYSGKYAGLMYVKSDMREVYENLTQFLLTVPLLMIATVLVAYFIALKVQKIISEPIDVLTKATEKIRSENNYSTRVKNYYDDEIGVLSSNFNKMLSEIESKDKALKKLNDNLEKMVHKRTKDLKFTISRLKNANDLNKRWIQNIGHELRTPIHIIQCYHEIGAECLEKDPVPLEKIKKSFNSIENSSERLNDLINDLLDFGKLEAGKIKFNFEECDLIESIDNAINEISGLAKSNNIKIDHVKPKKPLMLNHDKNRIYQVLTNLLSNAIKFSPEKSKITVTSSKTKTKFFSNKNQDALEIIVSDEGSGIPEKELESIFNTFEQSSITADGSGGTGLGLSISKEIVEMHSGKIYAINNKEKGASFIVQIPLNNNSDKEKNNEE